MLLVRISSTLSQFPASHLLDFAARGGSVGLAKVDVIVVVAVVKVVMVVVEVVVVAGTDDDVVVDTNSYQKKRGGGGGRDEKCVPSFPHKPSHPPVSVHKW
ncbi:hypothetical protein E2C01_005827 [Portunus trituberculatus]|uniref:Uncharacterized protein n=1 Tax=Portunus trituberculatus TaxID=210409 RepID=A0A5B7CTE5_PORTR|nr:hypothetical protein [Portunus trituberculatus]